MVDLFYANSLYRVLHIRCEKENCKHHIACSAMARLMLRSGEAWLEQAGASVHVTNTTPILLEENLVYLLNTKEACDFLVAYPANSNLLYPIEFR
jgi:hypothetical protein